MAADIIPIGACESCGRSKVMWEVELVPDETDSGDPLEVFRVCWDCIDPALDQVVKGGPRNVG